MRAVLGFHAARRIDRQGGSMRRPTKRASSPRPIRSGLSAGRGPIAGLVMVLVGVRNVLLAPVLAHLLRYA
jgi:hypothetical protein